MNFFSLVANLITSWPNPAVQVLFFCFDMLFLFFWLFSEGIYWMLFCVNPILFWVTIFGSLLLDLIFFTDLDFDFDFIFLCSFFLFLIIFFSSSFWFLNASNLAVFFDESPASLSLEYSVMVLVFLILFLCLLFCLFMRNFPSWLLVKWSVGCIEEVPISYESIEATSFRYLSY